MKPWTVLRSDLVIDHWPWLRVYSQDVQLPDGQELKEFYRVQSRDFAIVFALTPAQHVVMVESYRMGVGATCFELPAGGLDTPAEDPLVCAQRELLEETGYHASGWEHLGSYMLDSNRGICTAHLYLARGAETVAGQHLDDTEEIHVHLVDLPTLRAWLVDGHVRTLPTAAAAGLALERLGS